MGSKAAHAESGIWRRKKRGREMSRYPLKSGSLLYFTPIASTRWCMHAPSPPVERITTPLVHTTGDNSDGSLALEARAHPTFPYILNSFSPECSFHIYAKCDLFGNWRKRLVLNNIIYLELAACQIEVNGIKNHFIFIFILEVLPCLSLSVLHWWRRVEFSRKRWALLESSGQITPKKMHVQLIQTSLATYKPRGRRRCAGRSHPNLMIVTERHWRLMLFAWWLSYTTVVVTVKTWSFDRLYGKCQ